VFFEPQRTAYDLNWTMFGIPVRVHPFFWVMSAALGWPALDSGIEFLLLWIACVFLSVLVHEFGHVFMGILFGRRGHIVLYSFGGLAIGSVSLPRHWQRIAVSFAGPLAGFLLYGVVRLAYSQLDVFRLTRLSREVFHDLLDINLYWGLLNLLPIWPLDGGQISRDLLGWILPGKGIRYAFGVSFVVSGLLAVNALVITRFQHALPILDQIPYVQDMGGLWTVLLFGSLAFNSYQALQFENRRRPWERDDGFWDR
jgi:Zn-dependent protease